MPTPYEPELIFLGWDAPAVQLVGDRLLKLNQEDPDAFRRATIVTLTAPSAKRLREYVAEQIAEPILMPRIVQPGRLLPEKKNTEDEQLIAWVKTLQRLSPESYTTLLGEREGALSDRRALGTAHQLLRMRSLMEQEAQTPEEIYRKLEQNPDNTSPDQPFMDEESERWKEFSELCAEVDRLVPPNETVPQQPRPKEESMIILAALPELSARLRKTLENVLAERPGHVKVWVNAPEEERIHFDAWGMPVTEHWSDRPLDIPEESILKPADDAQDFGVKAVREAGGCPSDEVVLGLCDPSFSSDLCTAFAHAEGNRWRLQLSAGRKLTTVDAAQLPARLLHYVETAKQLPLSKKSASPLDIVDSEYVFAFLDLLRTGVLLRNTPAEGSMDATLDEVISENLPGSVQRFLDLLRKKNVDCFRRARQLYDLAQKCLASSTLPEALTEFADIIESSCPEPSPDTLLISTAMREAVQVCAAPDVTPELTLLMLQQRFESATCRPDQPDENEEPTVETVDWIELPYTRGERLLLLGLHEGCVPEAGGNAGFLTEKLKELVGLPTQNSRSARDAFLLTALLKSRGAAENVRILTARQGMEDDPIAPSPLLLRFPEDHADDLVKRVQKLFSDPEEAKEPKVYEQFRLLRQTASSPAPVQTTEGNEEKHPMESIELIAQGKPNPFSADSPFSPSLIKDFLTCPLRFWLNKLHGISPSDAYKDSTRELQANTYGTILHRILKQLVERYPELPQGDELDSLNREINEYARELLQQEFGAYAADRKDSLPVFLQNQRETMGESLKLFVDCHVKDLSEGWCCKHLEWSVNPDLDLPDGSLAHLKMIIDRVDYNLDKNTYRIIDYKTSGDKPQEKHLKTIQDKVFFEKRMKDLPTLKGENDTLKRWVEVQLPLNAYALMRLENPDTLPELAYYNLPRGKNVEYNVFKYSRKKLTAEVIESGIETARLAIDLIRRGLCLYSREDFGETPNDSTRDFLSFGTPAIDDHLRDVCGLSSK